MISNEQVLSVTSGVLLTCNQALRLQYAKYNSLSKVFYSVSGTFIITNYRLFFYIPQGMLLNVPVRYIAGIKFEGQQLKLDFFSALTFELYGDLLLAVAFLHGLLTPEYSPFYLFWHRTPNSNARRPEYQIQAGKCFVYAQSYKRLSAEGVLTDTQPSGRDLYDPFREYARQGVCIAQPTSEELSVMVFGQIVPPELIRFLMTNKPVLTLEGRAEAVKSMSEKNSGFFANEFYRVKRCEDDYDPRMLFDSEDEFYALLGSHPCHISEFITVYEHEQEELESQMQKDAQLSTEDSEDQTPAPLQQAISVFTKFTKQIKQAMTQEQYKPVVQFIPDYTAPCYCHGSFFAPSYFRQTPQQRQNLRNFIKKLALKFDCVHTGIPGTQFRISYLNAGYAVSPTYPAILAVPVEDDVLKQAMKFRSRGRIAALSYAYRGLAYLTRCAQPGSGFGLTRDNADEVLLKNACTGQLLVFDARYKLAAFGNVLSGKGFESKAAYPFTSTYYCGIYNIHAIRRSRDAILRDIIKIQASQADDVQFAASTFYESKWFEHLYHILFSANYIVDQISRAHVSCMVHCSDGWDRTSYLTSLAMLLMDPYYRTIKGFCALIAKEWLSFGHMFATRNRQVGSTKISRRKSKEYFQCNAGQNLQEAQFAQSDILNARDPQFRPLRYSDFRYSASQTSPIFFQFLDAVYYLHTQMPHKFEFTPRFLLQMARYAFNGRFGDFQFDSERQRTENLVFQSTESCFDDVLQNIKRYINPQYKPVNLSQACDDVLSCSWNSSDFRIFWDLWML